MNRIKSLSNRVLEEHKSKFGADFTSNKRVLDEITTIRSKSLRNQIAGYITRFIKKEIRDIKSKQARILAESKKSIEIEPKSEPQRQDDVDDTTKLEPKPKLDATIPKPISDTKSDTTTKTPPPDPSTTSNTKLKSVTTSEKSESTQ